MSINIIQWHAGIGNFYRYAHPLLKKNKNLSFNFDLRLIFMNSILSLLKIYYCFIVGKEGHTPSPLFFPGQPPFLRFPPF